MLVLGHFNYGKRGILDMTHCRLFTFGSFRRLFIQNGFRVEFVAGMPGPYPLALGDNALSRFVLRLNSLAIKINKGFFSYQIFMVSRSLPSLAYLLAHAVEQSEIRSNSQAIRSQCQSVCAQPSEKCA